MDPRARSLVLVRALAALGCLDFVGCGSVARKPEIAAQEETESQNCRASREYITTLEFLRTQKEFALSDDEAQRMAEKVAALCNGAAQRFIGTVNLLVRSTLPTRTALEVGVVIAAGSGAQSKAFQEIFRKTYLAQYLDLDAANALRIAKSLSAEFSGDPEAAARDYGGVVQFCVSSKGLDLARPYCAELGARVARMGDRFASGAARGFEEAFDFVMNSTQGPARPAFEGVQLAEEITSQGPSGLPNFREAYRYALSKGGLSRPEADALAFAKKLTRLSILKRKSD